MNKLLKVTLITAIMATSGMCGGYDQTYGQPYYNVQPIPYSPYDQYQTQHGMCLDACSDYFTELAGLTREPPVRSCCFEASLSAVAIAVGTLRLSDFFGKGTCISNKSQDLYAGLNMALDIISTAFAVRSIVPAFKVKLYEQAPPYHFPEYFVSDAQKYLHHKGN